MRMAAAAHLGFAHAKIGLVRGVWGVAVWGDGRRSIRSCFVDADVGNHIRLYRIEWEASDSTHIVAVLRIFGLGASMQENECIR
jgi:hypothetical protein